MWTNRFQGRTCSVSAALALSLWSLVCCCTGQAEDEDKIEVLKIQAPQPAKQPNGWLEEGETVVITPGSPKTPTPAAPKTSGPGFSLRGLLIDDVVAPAPTSNELAQHTVTPADVDSAAGTMPFDDAPLGFTGRSSVLPRATQTDPHFVPKEDRWRIGFPEWDRYGKGHPILDDYPYVPGRWWDPFNQNLLKGDYPIFGQNTFLAFTATSRSIFEYREVPIPTTPFESTTNPNSYPFFGRPNQFSYLQFLALSADLFHGDAAFKPADWRIKVTPIFNINYLAGEELAIVNPDVRRGVDRGRTFFALEEWFIETKLADLSADYDFVSVRIGSQPFTSDFRGFIFSDVNRGARLFGNLHSNRDRKSVV